MQNPGWTPQVLETRTGFSALVFLYDMSLQASQQVHKEDTLCPGLLMVDYNEYSPEETPPTRDVEKPSHPTPGVPSCARSLTGLADQGAAGI